MKHQGAEGEFVRQAEEIRARLIEYAAAHTVDELLTRALDEISALVDSPIAFFHFAEADQNTLSLQQWSTRTLADFCKAEGKGRHYPIKQAGVWADCLRQESRSFTMTMRHWRISRGCPRAMPKSFAS